MGSEFGDFSNGVNNYQYVDGTMFPGFDVSLNYHDLFDYKHTSLSLSPENPPSPQLESLLNEFITSSSDESNQVHSPNDSDSDPVLKYLNQILMEENMDEKPCMFQDSLALQAAERPFYDALGQVYPASPNQHPLLDHYGESSDDTSSWLTREHRGTTGITSTSNSVEPVQTQWPLSSFSSLGSNGGGSITNGIGMPSLNWDFLSQTESMIQFQKGVEEASKFLPKNNRIVIDVENMTFPDESDEEQHVVVKTEREDSPSGSRGRKVHDREDEDFVDGRSSKQSAVFADESELSEMFDKVLLCVPGSHEAHEAMKLELQNGQPSGSDGEKSDLRKHGGSENAVDLRTLLIQCAQATASDDRRTADQLLKQIRQHSSPLGDGSSRLAHYFANALEARLAGTGSQIFTALASKRTTAADIIKAYQVFISACPFKKISIGFAVHMILKAAENAKRLHIIDFGILYGFHWPILIQRLSERPGGPPKLCITGIDLPLPGFRPAERVEATGRRLAKYCERFNVPFEYHPIAQKWDTIKLQDLKISGDGVVAVSCLYRLRNLLDETIVVDSPRNAVLNLIRNINPDVFVHATVNGSFNAPFFITRFREALFHFSTLFDMLDVNIPTDHPERLMFEKEFYGREIMNVVACEGTERVERPETYKQWQVRITNAGFKSLPLDPELMKKLRMKVQMFYHKDFLIDVDGHWVLQGWKGRILYAVCAWTPR